MSRSSAPIPSAELTSCRQQSTHPDQVVGCCREGMQPVDPHQTSDGQLPQPRHGLHPPVDLFDELTLSLAHVVARVTGGAPVHRAAAVRVVLRDMGRDR